MKKIWIYLNTKIFPKIISFFKSFTFKDWLLLIIAILLLIFFFRCKYLSNKINHNQNYYTEQITIYKNKAGEAYSALQLAIKDKKDLLKENSELALEVKNLKDNPLIVTKINTKFERDTVYTETISIVERPTTDSIGRKTYDLNWAYNQEPEYFYIDGTTTVKNDFTEFTTVINKFSVDSKMTMDVIDNGKQLLVLVKSDNPYVNITGMQSVMIDPTKSKTLKNYFKLKRWGVGPVIGVGFDKNLKFTPYIGIGINYNVISF